MVVGMPLGRYFVFAGSLLLALLFLSDWYLPPLAATPARGEVDRTVIRLRSGHKWPERIVIDTSLPTIVPPPTRVADAPPARLSPARPPKEAMAMAMPIQAVAPLVAVKPVPKRRARIARKSGRLVGYETIGFRDPLAGW
jgi:hypothetical protein